MTQRGGGQEQSSSMGRLSSHFVVIIGLIFILCGMLYDIIRIELLDMKILPMKVDPVAKP